MRCRPGRPPEYCTDPAHNPVTAWRERRRLAAEQAGATSTEADTAQPLTMARITGAELLRGLAAETGRLTTLAGQIQQAIAVVGDPTAAEVELEATRTAAEQRDTTA